MTERVDLDQRVERALAHLDADGKRRCLNCQNARVVRLVEQKRGPVPVVECRRRHWEGKHTLSSLALGLSSDFRRQCEEWMA